MWGSWLDATKELADKARRAAEELERNLNDSAGIVATTTSTTTMETTTVVTSSEPTRRPPHDATKIVDDRTEHDDDDDDDDDDKVNNNKDDSLNCDAWDDDVDDVDIPDVQEEQQLQLLLQLPGTSDPDTSATTIASSPVVPINRDDPMTTTTTTPDHANDEEDDDDDDDGVHQAAPEQNQDDHQDQQQQQQQMEDPHTVPDDHPAMMVNEVEKDDDDDDNATAFQPGTVESGTITATTPPPPPPLTVQEATSLANHEPPTTLGVSEQGGGVADHNNNNNNDHHQPSSQPVDDDDATTTTANNTTSIELMMSSTERTTPDMEMDGNYKNNTTTNVTHPTDLNHDLQTGGTDRKHQAPQPDQEEEEMMMRNVHQSSPLVALPVQQEQPTETAADATGTGHDDGNDSTEAVLQTALPVVSKPLSDRNDNDEDESRNLMSIIEQLLSDEASRKMLEDRYRLVVTQPDDNKNRDEMNGAIASIQELQEKLHQREQQLFSKTEQITMMEAMHETEKQELLSKIHSTKEEAKRRIQKAKERVDAVELKLSNMTSQQSTSTAAREETIQQQSMLIAELRKEGEKLAQKQADMELVVRTSKTETRELRKQIADMEEETNMLSDKLQALEIDYKVAKGELSSARQGISQVDQLDTELRSVREENEKRASTILALEQAIKELKATNKDMDNELKVTRKGAAIETEQERKRLIMEHNQVVSDMEMKLQATEREAAIREDALRVEIDDLRKRWQESVRRADTLSVDIQANTAPLLRQIDSINKQSRIRATAWAELETQLRNEIENSILNHEKITKECNEWKAKAGRLDRTNKEYEGEMKQLKTELYEQHDAFQKLQHQYDEALYEIKQAKASLSDMERLSNESVTRVRSEVTRKLVDSEEQYRIQIESLEQQLQEERNLRSKVEVQLMETQSYKNHNDASQNVNNIDGLTMAVPPPPSKNDSDSQQRLRQSQGQAEILVGALGGLVGNDEYEDNDEEEATNDAENDALRNNGPMNSYAALEELTSRLKASKMELGTLRTRLMESEKARNELLVMVDDARVAREQLPLVEQRVQELTMENRDLQMEIQGLKDDIADVRELYRTQLNVLLEAQALSDKTTAGSIGRDEPNEVAT